MDGYTGKDPLRDVKSFIDNGGLGKILVTLEGLAAIALMLFF